MDSFVGERGVFSAFIELYSYRAIKCEDEMIAIIGTKR